MANVEQSEAWNGETGRHWAEHQDHYDTMLAPSTARLIAAAEIAAADRILDVGCGCGETSRIAARQAAEGSVLGVDLSKPMLERARILADRNGVRNVRFEQADAQVLPLPGEAFDLVLSRFGVMFFDDPRAAFANLFRALRRGGRIAMLCWRERARNPYITVPVETIAEFLPPPDVGDPDGPGPHSLADPERVRGLLDAAGFTEPAVESVTVLVRIGADAADAADFVRRLPTTRTMFTEAGENAITAAMGALREALTPYETPEGVLMDSAAWLVTARRP